MRRQGGLGIGLALVRSIVEMHGGSVTAESPGRGHGASFTVRFPAIEAVVAPEADMGTSPGVQLDGITVLVVEDDPDARGALRILLELAGARARVAGSASEALAVMAREPIDVVISDIAMPDEDGYSLVSKLRERQVADGGPRLITVALTGHASERDRDRALDAGFDAHVGKPVEPDSFVASVASLIAERPEAALGAGRTRGWNGG
jgi:CheY-like chemotaxis protein